VKILETKGLKNVVYESAAKVLANITKKKPELITSEVVSSLGKNLKTPGLAFKDYWVSANFLANIAVDTPNEELATQIVFYLARLDYYASDLHLAVSFVLSSINEKKPKLFTQDIVKSLCELLLKGNDTIVALEMLASKRPELFNGQINNIELQEFKDILTDKKVIEFLRRRGIIFCIEFLSQLKSSERFILDFLKKKDISLLDIIDEIRYFRSNSSTIEDILTSLVQIQNKKYETIRDAIILITDTLIISEVANLDIREEINEIRKSIDNYNSGKNGDKAFLSSLKDINKQVLKGALFKIIEREEGGKESISFLDNLDSNSNYRDYLFNLVRVYFRIKSEYYDTGEKIKEVLTKWIFEFKGDIQKLNEWLYKEADWNRDVYNKLINQGYSSLLWEKGFRKNLPTSSDREEEIIQQIKQVTADLITIAKNHNITLTSDNPPSSFKETEEFIEQYLKNIELTEEEKEDISRILKDVENLASTIGSIPQRVTVYVGFDFFRTSYAGRGVPGCFNPFSGSNKQMPLMHSLEADVLFLQVFQENKQIANAVLIFTEEGVVVQGLYNASNLSLDAVVFDVLADMLKQGLIPGVLMNNGSAGYNSAKPYLKEAKITSRKAKILTDFYYFDWGYIAGGFSTSYKLTQEDIADYTPLKDIQELTQEETKEKEEEAKEREFKSDVHNALFSLGFKHINLGAFLRQLDEVLKGKINLDGILDQLTLNSKYKDKEILPQERALIKEIILLAKKGLIIERISPQKIQDDKEYKEYSSLLKGIKELQEIEYSQQDVWEEEEIEELLKDESSISFIVKDIQGEVIGVIMARSYESAQKEDSGLKDEYLKGEKDKTLYIDEFLVHPDYRGFTVSLPLAKALLLYAYNNGFEDIFAHGRVNNGLSQILMRRYGAKKIGNEEDFSGYVGESTQLIYIKIIELLGKLGMNLGGFFGNLSKYHTR
ncbi:MAG: GNAT family N-acetyltransferase, partial [Candidatus Omnitrophica bacterium]|nr:GNAT family N-acetyltransferase [Candidatus Omnitrophota bacterium]